MFTELSQIADTPKSNMGKLIERVSVVKLDSDQQPSFETIHVTARMDFRVSPLYLELIN